MDDSAHAKTELLEPGFDSHNESPSQKDREKESREFVG